MSGRIAFGLATGAVACAAAFTVWALAFPAYTSGETLLEAHAGLPVRLAVAAPLTASVVGWLLPHVACRRDARWARASASALAWVLVAFALVTGFSIGLLVLPVAAALVAAAGLTPVTR